MSYSLQRPVQTVQAVQKHQQVSKLPPSWPHTRRRQPKHSRHAHSRWHRIAERKSTGTALTHCSFE